MRHGGSTSTALFVGCLLTAAAGCCGDGPMHRSAIAALRQTDSATRLTLDHGRLTRVAVATPLESFPQLVRRAIEAVQPAGEVLLAERVFDAADGSETFRTQKRYVIAPGTDTTVRTVEVSGEGQILRRSHTIKPGQANAAAQPTLVAAGSQLIRIDAWQAGREEGYTIRVRTAPDSVRVIELSDSGSILRRYDERPSTVQVSP